jgi:hypothetical protein
MLGPSPPKHTRRLSGEGAPSMTSREIRAALARMASTVWRSRSSCGGAWAGNRVREAERFSSSIPSVWIDESAIKIALRNGDAKLLLFLSQREFSARLCQRSLETINMLMISLSRYAYHRPSSRVNASSVLPAWIPPRDLGDQGGHQEIRQRRVLACRPGAASVRWKVHAFRLTYTRTTRPLPSRRRGTLSPDRRTAGGEHGAPNCEEGDCACDSQTRWH